MTFTTQIVRRGEGWDERPAEVSKSYDPYNVKAWASDALGAEGSSDDSKELFPDTFVDMAKQADSEIEDDYRMLRERQSAEKFSKKTQ